MSCFTHTIQTERVPLLNPSRSSKPEAPRRRLSAHWRGTFDAVRKHVFLNKKPGRASPVRDLRNHLQEAVDDGWKRRFHGWYRAVKVFLTDWADTDDPAAGARRPLWARVRL